MMNRWRSITALAGWGVMRSGISHLRDWVAGASIAAMAGLGCAGLVYAEVYPREDIIVNPAPGRFSVCHGGGCALVTQVSLSTAQWQRVADIFAVPIADPAREREKICDAIAAMEMVVGDSTGTADDRPENASGVHWSSQMDCIDESTNTSIYLRMLVGAGLLKWHRVEDRVTRGWFIFGWPHTTAVVRDTQSGEQWAVDSWFFANGERPAIVALAQWRSGWRPQK